MTVIKKILFCLWCVIRKTMMFVFIPSRNFSVVLIQSITWVLLVGMSLAWIQRSAKIVETTFFLSYNILLVSLIYWVLTFQSYLKNKKDRLYLKVPNRKQYIHENSKINDVIAEIEALKKSINNWAGINNRDLALERLKLLRMYFKVSSGKKEIKLLNNSIVAVILGVFSSIIFNKDIMNYIKGNHFRLVDESFINYANGITLLLIGIIIVGKFLIESHRFNKQNELYEDILNNLILEHEEKPVKTENNTPGI
ncbi:hypothetical protein [Bacillus haynesii]|uniref:hypothetical protein n=1 Tax=Bacillus haynesii TaxID=1925021 RepID=UPI00227F2B8E|nr:hypothetical protein [Bacillus haynesii]MCY8074261.1 hypothetical protein [Bacillus haynesii]